jgi:hypothetical protein
MIDNHIFDAKHVSQGGKQIVKCKLFNLTHIWSSSELNLEPYI